MSWQKNTGRWQWGQWESRKVYLERANSVQEPLRIAWSSIDVPQEVLLYIIATLVASLEEVRDYYPYSARELSYLALVCKAWYAAIAPLL